MSHTMAFPEGGTTITTYVYNADLSGDVVIRRVHEEKESQITIPTKHLMRFVAALVAAERVDQIEGMDWPEILGLKSMEDE